MNTKPKLMFSKTMDGLTLDRVQRDYEFDMPARHYHEEYEIYYLIKGERYYFIEKNTYLVQSPSLIFVPKHIIHKTASTGAIYHDRILLSINEEPFASFLSSINTLQLPDVFSRLNGVLPLTEEEHTYVLSLFNDIVKELNQEKEQYSFFVWSQLAQLLIFALRKKNQPVNSVIQSNPTTLKHKKVDEVASYIIKNCSNHFSIDFLAEHFYVSKSYLCRIFKDVTGFTITEFQNIQRINEASKRLLNTNDKISEISADLGYDSVTYFERNFRKHTGISPLAYRKKGHTITTV